MKNIYKGVYYVLILFFILGSIFISFFLFNFPDNLVKASSDLNLTSIEDIFPLLNELYILVGIVILLGLVAIAFGLINENSNKKEEIIYVSSNKQRSFKDTENEEKDINYETLDIDEKHLRGIFKDAVNKDSLQHFLTYLCNQTQACQAALMMRDSENLFTMEATYAYSTDMTKRRKFEIGDGLTGQVAKSGQPMIIDEIPEGYMKVMSGLGNAQPTSLLIFPLSNENNVEAIVEIAGFKPFEKKDLNFMEEINKIVLPLIKKVSK